jgi:DMSO/TMAO reductase YedYZ molybdopterin-dependent catalytic subunit
MNNKKLHLIITGIIVCFMMILTYTGCSTSSNNDQLRELAKVEIKEFEGKALSSILEFRENSIKGPQKVDITTYKLKIDGLVNKPSDYTYDEVLTKQKYIKPIRLNCVEGWYVDILWEGILLKDLLDQVEVKNSANTVIFYAEDGYSTSLPLDNILEKDMMLAYKMNGVTLPPERGYPFQLIAEDKLGYKWIKWITRIELSDDEDYLGYWEVRGYDNEADVKK